jgi:hypothetical protein
MDRFSIYQAVYEAMLNSYKVIVDKEDPYELMTNSPDEVVFAHHIEEPLSISEVEHMIVWWEDEEEYERCAKLKHIENEIKRLSKRNKKRRAKNPT